MRVASLTPLIAFFIISPGGSWSVDNALIPIYHHVRAEWLILLNFTLGKTVIVNGRLNKTGLDINYLIERLDSFANNWLIQFHVVIAV